MGDHAPQTNRELTEEEKRAAIKAGEEQKRKERDYDHSKDNPNEYSGATPREGLGDWGGPAGEYFAGKYPPPAVPVNGAQGGKGVRVSTDALKLFASNIRALLPTLKSAQKQIRALRLAPGVFWDSYNLVQKVVAGKEGTAIAPTTDAFLGKAIDAITAVADDLDKLALAYKTAEELNAATGKDLAEHIENAKAYVAKAVGGAV